MTALTSWLPKGGENLFQRIKAQRAAAEARGVTILNLAIGQPQGPPLLSARKAAAEAVLSDSESMHEYQDNGSLGVNRFAEEFVEFHTGPLPGAELAYLPIPGIKPMLGLVPLACGCSRETIYVHTTTDPGYPTPADWCGYLGWNVQHTPLTLSPANGFRFSTEDICRNETRFPKLVMMNYPHNPSGQVATRDWLWRICQYCEQYNIRLFNDAAYVALKHTAECTSLAQVAVDFPLLSWAEAYSASKLGNFTGWRVGAIAGSPDFIGDIARVKGNTDSGFVAPMAAGVLAAIRQDREGIDVYRQMYRHRIGILLDELVSRGMRLAVVPGAGFFTLWLAPDFAFGEPVPDAAEFNRLMIENTGVVGVHFHPYIRYAVVGDVEAMVQGIKRAFEQANVSYKS